jgi:transposase
MIARPAPSEYAPFYAGYVERVPEGDVLAQLARQLDETRALLGDLPPSRAVHRYAAGKWSVAEVVGHVTDAERIFAYRALRIARGDATPLASFDENAYVPAGSFDRRTLPDLLDELATVRYATLTLMRGLPAEAWARSGVASGRPVSVGALAYIIAGHELHHVAILRERYGIG